MTSTTPVVKPVSQLELWIYSAGTLKIYVFESDDLEGETVSYRYTASETSPTFPEFPIRDIIPGAIARAREIGTSQVLLEFEDWLRQRVKD